MSKKVVSKSLGKWGFSLIEVLLAIGILGGTILCLLGLFTPVFSKTKETERIRKIGNIEGKIDGFIQSCSFNEIFTYTKEGLCFYFYEDEKGAQKITREIDETNGSSVIKVMLNASGGEDIATFESRDYPKSYLPICVRVYCPNQKNNKSMQSPTLSFITIKNR